MRIQKIVVALLILSFASSHKVQTNITPLALGGITLGAICGGTWYAVSKYVLHKNNPQKYSAPNLATCLAVGAATGATCGLGILAHGLMFDTKKRVERVDAPRADAPQRSIVVQPDGFNTAESTEENNLKPLMSIPSIDLPADKKIAQDCEKIVFILTAVEKLVDIIPSTDRVDLLLETAKALKVVVQQSASDPLVKKALRRINNLESQVHSKINRLSRGTQHRHQDPRMSEEEAMAQAERASNDALEADAKAQRIINYVQSTIFQQSVETIKTEAGEGVIVRVSEDALQSEDGEEKESMCLTCQEEISTDAIDPNNPVCTLTCKHQFHAQCLAASILNGFTFCQYCNKKDELLALCNPKKPE